MFFNLGTDKLSNFPQHWAVGSLWLSTDAGWNHVSLGGWQLVYKGYAEAAQLDLLLPNILTESAPQTLGNFCVVAWNDAGIRIFSDRWRGFPIWYNQHQCITNLTPCDHTAWTDSIVSVDFDLRIREVNFDAVGTLDSTPLTKNEAVDIIDQRLRSRISQFLSNNKRPLKVFLSGGVDTLLVWSYVHALGAEFELVDYLHVDLDQFWRCNSHHLAKFWAYKQIHHWKESVCLASGAPGDEFMLRSPTTADLWLRRRGTSIPNQLSNLQQCLHRDYFQQAKHQYIFDCHDQKLPESTDWQLCNMVLNDWQHWHIGNTLTWTPLRDLEIFKVFLRLSVTDAVDQIMNSSISRLLIERNAPGACSMLGDQKNTGAVMANLKYQQLRGNNL